MPKIKIDKELYTRAKTIAVSEGYSSLEEFIVHIIEKEISRLESSGDDRAVSDQLRGLGYIE